MSNTSRSKPHRLRLSKLTTSNDVKINPSVDTRSNMGSNVRTMYAQHMSPEYGSPLSPKLKFHSSLSPASPSSPLSGKDFMSQISSRRTRRHTHSNKYPGYSSPASSPSDVSYSFMAPEIDLPFYPISLDPVSPTGGRLVGGDSKDTDEENYSNSESSDSPEPPRKPMKKEDVTNFVDSFHPVPMHLIADVAQKLSGM